MQETRSCYYSRACSEYRFAEEVKHGRIVVVSNVSGSGFEHLEIWQEHYPYPRILIQKKTNYHYLKVHRG